MGIIIINIPAAALNLIEKNKIINRNIEIFY